MKKILSLIATLIFLNNFAIEAKTVALNKRIETFKENIEKIETDKNAAIKFFNEIPDIIKERIKKIKNCNDKEISSIKDKIKKLENEKNK